MECSKALEPVATYRPGDWTPVEDMFSAFAELVAGIVQSGKRPRIESDAESTIRVYADEITVPTGLGNIIETLSIEIGRGAQSHFGDQLPFINVIRDMLLRFDPPELGNLEGTISALQGQVLDTVTEGSHGPEEAALNARYLAGAVDMLMAQIAYINRLQAQLNEALWRKAAVEGWMNGAHDLLVRVQSDTGYAFEIPEKI